MAILSGLAAGPALAGGCDLLDAATAKELHAARRVTVHLVDGEVTTDIVSVFGTDKLRQSEDGGKSWQGADYDPEYALTAQRQMEAKNHQTCRADGSETRVGDVADIVLVRHSDGYRKRVWIARGSGLPVHVEETYAGGMRGTLDYDYGEQTP